MVAQAENMIAKTKEQALNARKEAIQVAFKNAELKLEHDKNLYLAEIEKRPIVPLLEEQLFSSFGRCDEL